MIYPVPVFAPVFGESGAARIVRIVRSYDKVSLSNRRADLAALVGRGVDDGDRVVTISTNCGTSALGVLRAAGCPHLLVSKPYVSGMAIAWLVQIGRDMSAWRDPVKDGPPQSGALCWYEIAGENDDHVEWELDNGDHGGGGRTNNAITVEHGPVALSMGRPLKAWLDPEALSLPEASDPGDPVAGSGGEPVA